MDEWSSTYFERPGTVTEWWDPLSADDPAARAWFTAQLDDVVALAEPENRRVLDAAAGRGRAAVACALAGASEVVAVDISAEMLDIARRNAESAGADVRFERANLERLPFDDGTFDRALLLEVLLHFDNPQAVLRELARVLAPGGRLVVTTNGANPLARLAQPGRAGAHPASRLQLAGVTAVNELMTSLFGFGWRRTRATSTLYNRIFRVPVRPLYPWSVRRLLSAAGLTVIEHRAVPSVVLPREHRWLAEKR